MLYMPDKVEHEPLVDAFIATMINFKLTLLFSSQNHEEK